MAAASRTHGPRLATRLLIALLVTLAVLALDTRFGAGPVLAPLELRTLDWRYQVRGPRAPSGETVLVLADDPSLAAIGAWPPPRELLAAAVDRVAAAGADVIVLNLLLTERDSGLAAEVRGVLEASRAALPATDPLRARLDRLLDVPEADARLARSLAAAGNVVLPYAFVREAAAPNAAPLPAWLAATAYRVQATTRDAAPPAFRPGGLILPVAALGAAAATVGHVSLLLETDGSLRAELPALPYRGELYPSAAIEAARLRLGLARDQVASEGTRGIRLGERVLAVDEAGRHLVDYLGPEATVPTHALADLLAARVPETALAGKIVVLGAAASGAGDRFASPFTARLPGSEHLATAIDNLLTGRVLRRDPTVRALDRLLTAGLALAAALLAGRRSPWASLAALGIVLTGFAGLLQLAFAAAAIWLAAIPPAVAALATGTAVEGLRLAHERRRRQGLERQKANLARYFAPAVVERLATSDHPTALDRTQDAVVMFVDIVGFTRRSETMPPAAAMALLRGFHGAVERAVFAHGGMVDKFIGDGALACFGVPEPSPTAAADAIRAALALLHELAPGRDGTPPVAIGVHAGPVLMGDIGGATQFQFTVVGDTVNVASRLEALTRQHATPLIVSDRVLQAAQMHLAPEIAARFLPLGPLPIRGRASSLEAWRLASGTGGAGHLP